MKKIFIACLVLFILMSSVVTVHAEAKKGLNSTWYQKKGIEEDNAESANFTSLLGTSSDPKGNWASTRETLFENLDEVKKMTVDTFEIPSRNDSTEWVDLAEEAGVIMTNGEWAPEYVVIKYEGFIVAKEAGEYQLLSSYVDNGFVCYINDKLVFEYWGPEMWLDDSEGHTATHEGDKFTMEADKAYKFEAYYFEGHGGEILAMDVKQNNGTAKAFSSSGLMMFTAEPTADELAQAKLTPSPSPTASPAPTKAATSAPANTSPKTSSPSSEGNDEDSEFPVVPVAVGGGIAILAIAAGIIFAMKRKK